MPREKLHPQPGSREWEMLYPPELRDPWIMEGFNEREKVSSHTRIVGPNAAFSIYAMFPEGVTPDPDTKAEVERELEIRSRFLVPGMRKSIQEIIDAAKPTAEILEFKPKDQ